MCVFVHYRLHLLGTEADTPWLSFPEMASDRSWPNTCVSYSGENSLMHSRLLSAEFHWNIHHQRVGVLKIQNFLQFLALHKFRPEAFCLAAIVKDVWINKGFPDFLNHQRLMFPSHSVYILDRKPFIITAFKVFFKTQKCISNEFKTSVDFRGDTGNMCP